MKCIRFVFFIFLFFLPLTPLVRANSEGFKATVKDEVIVIGRGIINVATCLLELPRAYRVEKRNHSRLWPVGLVPRYFTYTVFRFVSGAMDAFFHPWIIPFSEGTPRPWTEPMGLPDYVWQKGDVDF